MSDIYLSYNESNFDVAQILKQDVEACSNLSITLENDSWEEEDEFMKALPHANLFIIIATATSNITVWVIDHQKNKKRRQRAITKALTVDFSHSYEDGMKILTSVLKRVTGRSRFQKSRPKKQTKPPKEVEEPRIEQKSEAEPSKTMSNQAFMIANALPAGSNKPQSQERESDLLEVVPRTLNEHCSECKDLDLHQTYSLKAKPILECRYFALGVAQFCQHLWQNESIVPLG